MGNYREGDKLVTAQISFVVLLSLAFATVQKIRIGGLGKRLCPVSPLLGELVCQRLQSLRHVVETVLPFEAGHEGQYRNVTG